jgi:hypothetical protein
LISKLADIRTNAAADYLKELYHALEDTVQLQYPILESLLKQKTSYAYSAFRDIINAEPPVIQTSSDNDHSDYTRWSGSRRSSRSYSDGNFLDDLSDSLQLTKTILPDLLPLVNLDDYKSNIMQLLGQLVDSNLVTSKDYEPYFSKFLIEARQELKKQSIAEKKKAINKAEESKTEKKPSDTDESEEKDYGNDDLGLYATLLLPFNETNAAVQPVLNQMLKSDDKRLKYSTLLLLLRNNKPYPDSLLKYFAGSDEYRYELYTDLKKMKKSAKFPAQYNNHLDLGKSCLLDKKSYDKPDSVIYLDRLPATYKGKKGFIYFYKYKTKKDDLSWKLATVGLIPEDPNLFEFKDDNQGVKRNLYVSSLYGSTDYNRYDFTDFTGTKIEEDEPLVKQLNKTLKKILYSRRKSAKNFYDTDSDRSERNYSVD